MTYSTQALLPAFAKQALKRLGEMLLGHADINGALRFQHGGVHTTLTGCSVRYCASPVPKVSERTPLHVE